MNSAIIIILFSSKNFFFVFSDEKIPEFGYGINLLHLHSYETGGWPLEAVENIINTIGESEGYHSLKTIRVWMPAVKETSPEYMKQWKLAVEKAIIYAANNPNIKYIVIVIGHGLEWMVTPEIYYKIKQNPPDKKGYIEGLAEIVRNTVSEIYKKTSNKNVEIIWQIENELDIASIIRPEPVWDDVSFCNNLCLSLQNAVVKGWGEKRCMMMVSYSPFYGIVNKNVYPFNNPVFDKYVKILGLHYYNDFRMPPDIWWRKVKQNIISLIKSLGKPVIIGETGTNMKSDEEGNILKDEEYIIQYIHLAVKTVKDLEESGYPCKGLIYFKFDDSLPNAEEKVPEEQRYTGFYKYGGKWFGHTRKKFVNKKEYIGPWEYYTKIAKKYLP